MAKFIIDYLEENNNMTQRYINLDQQHQTLFRDNKETKTQLSDLREVYSSVSKELGHAIIPKVLTGSTFGINPNSP